MAVITKSPEARPPYEAYARIMGVFAGRLAAAGGVARLLDRDPREPDQERPVQTGDMEQAIGELVTCSRCIGTWAAAGLATGQILTPRLGRMVTWTLAAAGVNDFLQAGFAGLTRKANDLENDT